MLCGPRRPAPRVRGHAILTMPLNGRVNSARVPLRPPLEFRWRRCLPARLSPFADPTAMRGAVWLEPPLRAAVSYAEVVDGRLRAPSWRGLLLDEAVGAAEKRLLERELQRAGGLEVNHELELFGPLHGKLGGLRALQDPYDIRCGATE